MAVPCCFVNQLASSSQLSANETNLLVNFPLNLCIIMCESTTESRVHLDPLIEKVTERFKQNVSNVSYELSMPDDSFFLSNMFFVRITMNEEKIDVVVKKPSPLDYVREMLESDVQFHNEIVFYEKYSKEDDEVPRCFYTEEKPPVDSVLVLENIKSRGYSLSHWKYDIPLEYTHAAFRTLARFHGKCYAMKEHQPDRFFDIVSNLWPSRYRHDSQMNVMMNGTATRAVEYLRRRGYDKTFCDRLEAKWEDVFGNVVMDIVRPEEPLSTLCHGDFTMNNVFFKRENGQLKAMLIDFALVRYGSPVIDLSTLLCLHCARDLDKNLLDNVLKVYHDALIEVLKERGVEDLAKYSYQAFYEDYRKKGIFGFFISTFFLSMVMGKNTMSPEEMMQMDYEKSVLVLREMGGDEISEILANMLLKLKEFGCLDD
ncbi:uncharacterized protein LOC100878772 [Megachile rotundata]|uniref:uncharacterized protein LOC100878772 n=1 Tax=Megachile rotundata TaxID=143995 RepID=UPI003FD42707